VHLAKELVDYDPEVENAINYVFGQFVSEIYLILV
jgi:chromosome segregation ATPase